MSAGTGAPHAMRLLLGLMDRLVHGELTIVLPDGTRHSYRRPEPGPSATVNVRRWRVARRLLTGGNVGFAEAYTDGDWDSPDVARVLELAALNARALDPRIFGGNAVTRLAGRLRHALRGNTRRGSKRNIAFHYDLGNDFYAAWLDPSMTYSSAIFGADDQDLEAAQANKNRRLARLLKLAPDQHVLEIGCGWGGFAELAAKEFGARVTGITVSREQLDFARRRIAKEGLTERVDFHFIDYRDVRGHFDRIASIEMIEAVGERYWPDFFRSLRDNLKPGGIVGLQAITIADERYADYRRKPDFIQRYIFPGGMLPAPGTLADQVRQAGLRWLGDAGFGAHYARTLKTWNDRFQSAWPGLSRHDFDERFKRIWEYYLAYCEAGFRAGTIDVRQIALARD